MGGGFGLSARRAGASVVQGDEVAWKPAVVVDVLGAQIVAILALLTVRHIGKSHSKQDTSVGDEGASTLL